MLNALDLYTKRRPSGEWEVWRNAGFRRRFTYHVLEAGPFDTEDEAHQWIRENAE